MDDQKADIEPRPGTLDDGFNIIAKDMDRAFSIGLSANQAAIMMCVREQSWTASLLARRKGEPRPSPVPAKINLTHLAADTGLNRSRLSLALKDLVTSKILTQDGAGVLIAKNYVKWLNDEGTGPRFDAKQIAYIRAAKRKEKSPIVNGIGNQLPLQSATPNGIHENQIADCLPLQSATVEAESTVAKRNGDHGALLQSATHTVAKRNGNCCKAQQPHIEDRAPEDSLDFRDRRIEEGRGEESRLPPPVLPSQSLAENQPHSAVDPSAPNLRSAEDMKYVKDAMGVLVNDLNHEAIGYRIGQEHNTRANIVIPGWKWYVASYKLSAGMIKDSKRRDWNYFAGVARNATEEEFHEAVAALNPDPAGQESGPLINGAPVAITPRAVPVRESVHEQRKRAFKS